MDGPGDGDAARRATIAALRAMVDRVGVHEPVGEHELGAEDNPFEKARGIALRRLAVRGRSASELGRDLKSRGVTAEVARDVIERFGQVGLVDDKRFADDWVAQRREGKGLSRARLRRELQGKGIAAETIDAALATIPAGDETEVAIGLARRRWERLKDLDPVIAQRRLSAYLARRGFSPETTQEAAAAVLDGRIDGDDDD